MPAVCQSVFSHTHRLHHLSRPLAGHLRVAAAAPVPQAWPAAQKRTGNIALCPGGGQREVHPDAQPTERSTTHSRKRWQSQGPTRVVIAAIHSTQQWRTARSFFLFWLWWWWSCSTQQGGTAVSRVIAKRRRRWCGGAPLATSERGWRRRWGKLCLATITELCNEPVACACEAHTTCAGGG